VTDFPDRPLRIGTRSSPMARTQTDHVADLLRGLDSGLRIETVATITAGDTWPGDLSQVGGKGLFVKAIDEQLQRGEIDLAVHCLKDVPGDQPLPSGLTFAAMLPRGDVRDVLLVRKGSPVTSLNGLPHGAGVATSAVRRRAQLLALRPDLRMVDVRGAVGTRLEKLDRDRGRAGLAADAMVLAREGLVRLGLTSRIRCTFTVAEMLPAVGAGVLAVECREDDEAVTKLLARLNDPRTQAESNAERAMLHGLHGHCNSPIAGHCTTGPDGQLSLRGMVFSGDGAQFVRAHLHADSADEATALGSRVSTELLRQGANILINSA
jgi:hydroxymethylbilane synthase